MKIKTKLRISAVLPIVMAVFVVSILLWREHNLRLSHDRYAISEQTAGDAFRLQQLTEQVIDERHPVAVSQWRACSRTLTAKLLAAVPASATEDQILATILQYNKTVSELFGRLSAAEAARTSDPATGVEASEIGIELERDIQELIRHCRYWTDFRHTSTADEQRLFDFAIMLVTLILAIVLTATTAFLSRSLASGVTELSSGLADVSRGNFGQPLAIEGNDELGELARTFNTMTQDLQESYEALQSSNAKQSQNLEKLRRASDQTLKQERLQAVSQMARGIVHDFNDALSPIMTASDLLLSRRDILDQKDIVIECLEAVHNGCQKVQKQILQLSGLIRDDGDGKRHEIDVNELIAQVVRLTQPQWQKKIGATGTEIEFVTDFGNLPPLFGHSAPLRSAITILLLNAVDAIVDTGTITFRTSCDGQSIVLEVIDTGQGMTDEVRRHCAEPFFTTKDDDSTGMGLTVAYAAIERHNGSIAIDSEVGKGTTFTIRLPLRTGMTPEAGPSPRLRSSLHVLLIIGDPLTREVVTAGLQSHGHRVEAATSGSLGVARTREGSHDLIIQDGTDTDMKPVEVMAALRSVTTNCPIVLVAPENGRPDDPSLGAASFDDIVERPVTEARLLSAIDRLFAG